MPIHDPRTDPRACSQCKSENVTEADTMRPSGIAPQIVCDNGHVTNGMPTAAFFDDTPRSTLTADDITILVAIAHLGDETFEQFTNVAAQAAARTAAATGIPLTEAAEQAIHEACGMVRAKFAARLDI